MSLHGGITSKLAMMALGGYLLIVSLFVVYFFYCSAPWCKISILAVIFPWMLIDALLDSILFSSSKLQAWSIILSLVAVNATIIYFTGLVLDRVFFKKDKKPGVRI